MGLQREGRARVYNNAFHLEARAEGDALIPTPGAVVAGEGFRLGRALRLQLSDGSLDVLGAVFVSHEHSVRHGDRNDVFEADCDELLILVGRLKERVLAVV